MTYDDPHWYMDAHHFHNSSKHMRLLQIVRSIADDRLRGTPDTDGDSLLHRSALEHYLTTYSTPELPPSWLMVETLTIGQLSSTIQNLRRRADKTAIASSIGLTAPVLESWIRTYVRVRNICAHHGRLWNVGLGVYPVIPTSRALSWISASDGLPTRSNKRLYPVLISLQSVLDVVSPRSTWARRLHSLVEQRPSMNLEGMGIPKNWADDAFWRRHIG